ncbi:hypothetical protein [Bartonella henselae]|nr:hypothetical protein [Bartonella henselae]
MSLQFQTGLWAAMAAVFVFYPVIGIAFLGVLFFIAIIQSLDEILPIVAVIALILIVLIAFIALIKFIWRMV